MSRYDPPDWLRRFVSEEVRPLLQNNTSTTFATLKRWQAQVAKQRRQREKWESKQTDHLRRLVEASPERPNPSADSPGEGWTWCEWWRDPANGEEHHVRAWLPPELSVANAPPIYDNPLRHIIVRHDPITPDLDRDNSPEECLVALLAIHDEVRVREERIVPIDSLHYRTAVPFAVVSGSVRELTDQHLPDLHRMVRIAGECSMTSVEKKATEKVLSKAQITLTDRSAFIRAKACRNDHIKTHKQLTGLLNRLPNDEHGIRREHRGQHLWVHGGDWHRWDEEQEKVRQTEIKRHEDADPRADLHARAVELQRPEIQRQVLTKSLDKSPRK